MTAYDDTFRIAGVLFDTENLTHTLGEVLSNAGKTQLRIAETEKYPHVTFFFSGGRETPFEGEQRIMIPSPKVPTYDMQPEMSANGIVEAITAHLETHQPDFICLNFANPDMVGHTGVFDAVVRAVETVDQCLGQLVRILEELNYSMIILADHGNAEFMVNEDGSPNTAHTTSLVPLIIIDPECNKVAPGKLGDVATTILHIMGLETPLQMTGEVLVS
jgi:2,3-bisphosphoglycerate-independent phosphoglycerate mutase